MVSDAHKSRVLIANRGEIAVRAARACRFLGLGSVAVYSTADASSPHVWVADQAVCIGPPAANASYLNRDALVHVAQAMGCTHVYPGYGFLAENADFAERCAEEGLTFIGPSPECIRLMGDKASARQAAAQYGVPIVPGSSGTFTEAGAALDEARRIGFPLLLKASSGGGGRGMRVAGNEDVFAALFSQASREAQEAFGDSSIYLERYFDKVRHIEVQVFGDARGNVCQLGERDCTVQRRHQKLVEESPSPVLVAEERAELLEAARRLAEGVGYVGAGTVEFIFDETERAFYFIEMNTRIQVEHPVTEMLVGHDLVAEQIRVAMGEMLSVADLPAEIPCGHAIEFRINAEDAERNFTPSPGRVTTLRLPSGGDIRVDTFAYPGIMIQPFYDSMIMKLIVRGDDRAAALTRARAALDSFEIKGIATTAPFHRRLLDDEDFIAGSIHTKWVEDEFLPRIL